MSVSKLCKDYREGKLSDHRVTKSSQANATLPLNSSHLVYILRSWLAAGLWSAAVRCEPQVNLLQQGVRLTSRLGSKVSCSPGVKRRVGPSRRVSRVSVTGCTFASQLSPVVGGRCSDTSAGSAATVAAAAAAQRKRTAHHRIWLLPALWWPSRLPRKNFLTVVPKVFWKSTIQRLPRCSYFLSKVVGLTSTT